MAKDTSRVELVGFEVLDREPIDAALTAFGVPGEELGLWSINCANSVPQNTYDYRKVMVDTGLLSKQMREATGDNFNEFTYCEQFSEHASSTILSQMALHVTMGGRPLPPMVKRNGTVKRWPAVNVAVAAVGTIMATSHNPIFSLIIGGPYYNAAKAWLDADAEKPVNDALKLMREVKPSSGYLKYGIGQVLLPKYATVIAAGASVPGLRPA